MPCCIAIIHFLQCNHKTMFKLGCTEGCDELCESSQQATLLLTKYLWRCEDCHAHHWSRHEDARAEAWDRNFAAVQRDEEVPTEIRQQILETLHKRERVEEKRLEPTRVQQVEEVQWVAEWTFEYGAMLWDVMYGHEWEPDAAAKRIEELRTLRLWDLVVATDVLRSTKELEEEQGHTPWLIGYDIRLLPPPALPSDKPHVEQDSDKSMPPPPPPPIPRFAKLSLNKREEDVGSEDLGLGQDSASNGKGTAESEDEDENKEMEDRNIKAVFQGMDVD